MEDGSPQPNSDAYAGMIDRMRSFLDSFAGARMDDAAIAALDADLKVWTERLKPFAVAEAEQSFGRHNHLAGRGQVMSPRFVVEAQDAQSMAAHVTFGRYFLGAGGAAHGGAIALLFDEVLGIVGNISGEAIARTAYLHVDFRSITPIEKQLQVSARLERVEGRKRFIKGEIRDGDRLCVEAEALFVELRPGQP